MLTKAALGIPDEAEFDPGVPVAIFGVPLGEHAAIEAARLLSEPSSKDIAVVDHDSRAPQYFSLTNVDGSIAEVCHLEGLISRNQPWPTAAEVALVHCASELSEPEFLSLTRGEKAFVVRDHGFPESSLEIAHAIRMAQVGPNDLIKEYSGLTIESDLSVYGSCIKILSQSFATSPIKYRYIELYRILETIYLKDAFEKFSQDFFSDPDTSVKDISEKIRSERMQLYSLCENIQDAVELFDLECEKLKSSNNRYIWGISKSIGRKFSNGLSPSWKRGCSNIYAIRCSIVHAGERDVVFDVFDDGHEAIEALIPPLETIALRLLGIRMAT
jgi:hypothetical protein